ncbi:hypothetical protein BKA62DRAFT_245819 [Auriculariales sp. MPI-PUGE-AT-0066]|nr:hypothetical protein BKA62DRAFT_245819 [Auriculariales sp. MPI-PUGE-AT-0066]
MTSDLSLSALPLSRLSLESLPIEVLASIIAASSSHPRSLYQVGQVCRALYQVVLSEGLLWSNIVINHSTRLDSTRRQLELSGASQLNVTIEGSHDDRGDSVREVFKQFERIAHLDIIVANGNLGSHLHAPLTDGRLWPALETLIVQTEEFDDESGMPYTSEVDLRAPRLRGIQLFGVTPRDWRHFGLGQPLQHAKWRAGLPRDAATVESFLRCLVDCSALRALGFSLPGTNLDQLDLNCCTLRFPNTLKRLEVDANLISLSLIVNLLAGCCDVQDIAVCARAVTEDLGPHVPQLLGIIPYTRLQTLAVICGRALPLDTSVPRLSSAFLSLFAVTGGSKHLTVIHLRNAILPGGLISACSALQNLHLQGVEVRSDFSEDLAACRELTRVELALVLTGTRDDDQVNTRSLPVSNPLPLLQSASAHWLPTASWTVDKFHAANTMVQTFAVLFSNPSARSIALPSLPLRIEVVKQILLSAATTKPTSRRLRLSSSLDVHFRRRRSDSGVEVVQLSVEKDPSVQGRPGRQPRLRCCVESDILGEIIGTLDGVSDEILSVIFHDDLLSLLSASLEASGSYQRLLRGPSVRVCPSSEDPYFVCIEQCSGTYSYVNGSIGYWLGEM